MLNKYLLMLMCVSFLLIWQPRKVLSEFHDTIGQYFFCSGRKQNSSSILWISHRAKVTGGTICMQVIMKWAVYLHTNNLERYFMPSPPNFDQNEVLGSTRDKWNWYYILELCFVGSWICVRLLAICIAGRTWMREAYKLKYWHRKIE